MIDPQTALSSSLFPRDEIALRVADRLAPDVGPKLRAYVEKLIALGEDAVDDAPPQRIDNASILGLASLLMTAVTFAAGELHRYQDEVRRRQERSESRQKSSGDRTHRNGRSAPSSRWSRCRARRSRWPSRVACGSPNGRPVVCP